LREYFKLSDSFNWDNSKSIVSQIAATPKEAMERLSCVGLNSVPDWCKPRSILSTGQGFRADLASILSNDSVIDEFTSTVDRTVAKSISTGVRRYVDKYNLRNVVLASCHYDIIDWLQPDWVFDTTIGFLPRGSLQQRPKIELEIEPCRRSVWSIFAPHHYLSGKIAQSRYCWWVWWNEVLVGFSSSIPFPHPKTKRARREHRTVILPDFQGLGIGVRVSDEIARHHVEDLGYKYYSRTAHPRMGEYREKHPNWKPTDSNKKKTRRGTENLGNLGWQLDLSRICYSHEYVSSHTF
jgi:GNAT superfamily N-acetyltransferase